MDVWHCDAAGSYSDVRDAGFDTRGQQYLRGYQVTDAGGLAQFQTIYPGWYSGRTVHIHFKVRLFTGSETAYEFTSQLFFDDSLTDQVFTQSPYNTKGIRNTRNNQDGIYNGGGSQLILNLTQEGLGYSATFDIALEGITVATGASPKITGAPVTGKQSIVSGLNFDSSAVLFLNGERQKKTSNDESNPTTILISRKAGKLISPGQTVSLQVRNSDNSLSNEFSFTRAVARKSVVVTGWNISVDPSPVSECTNCPDAVTTPLSLLTSRQIPVDGSNNPSIKLSSPTLCVSHRRHAGK